jgi:tRNA(fMet)-specific endonuclease VapC
VYLLDTNICIYAIKNKSPKVLEAVKEKLKKGIHISSLTIAELEYGIENSNRIEENRIALLKFLSIFNILYFTDTDAILYGRLKKKLKTTGQLIGPIDMLLAAQALSRNLIFVTNNVKEFERIADLRIENWTLNK